MKERNIKISLEKAKEWYNSNDSTLKDLALQAFNMNELEEKSKYPKTIKEFQKEHPIISDCYYISTNNNILRDSRTITDKDFLNSCNLNYIYSSEEAIAIQTLITLRLIRKVSYVKDWERDLNSPKLACCIYFDLKWGWVVCDYNYITSLFSFPTEEMATEFLNNFKDELKKIEPLFK